MAYHINRIVYFDNKLVFEEGNQNDLGERCLSFKIVWIILCKNLLSLFTMIRTIKQGMRLSLQQTQFRSSATVSSHLFFFLDSNLMLPAAIKMSNIVVTVDPDSEFFVAKLKKKHGLLLQLVLTKRPLVGRTG